MLYNYVVPSHLPSNCKIFSLWAKHSTNLDIAESFLLSIQRYGAENDANIECGSKVCLHNMFV